MERWRDSRGDAETRRGEGTVSSDRLRPLPGRGSRAPGPFDVPHPGGMVELMGRILLLVGCLGMGLLAAEPPARTPGAPRTLLVLGDSLGAGYGVEPEEAWPALLQDRINQARLPYTVVNASVSGDTTAGGLRRLDWQLKRPVDVLVLELGGNDGLRGLPPATTRSNLTDIITRTRARNPEAAVVLAGMQMPASHGPEFARDFAAVYPAVAQAQKAHLVPALLEGVAGVAELNQADQIHPTPAGHARVASNVWVVLEPVLRSRTSAPR